MLDLNLGFGKRAGPDIARWLVSELTGTTDLDICLDSANPEVLRAGLEEARAQGRRRPPLINSFNLDPAKLEHILPLAAEFEAEIIGYCVRDTVPQRDEDRLLAAAELVQAAESAGVPRERLFLDPILFPLASFQEDLGRVLTFLRLLPEVVPAAPRILVGLSNVGYGLPARARAAVEAAVLPLLWGVGLDAVLLNLNRPELRNATAIIRAIEMESVFTAADLQTER